MLKLFELPLSTTSYSYKHDVVLDGLHFIIWIQYNSRKDGWILSLHDMQDIPIISGTPVRISVDILSQFRHLPNIPVGQIMAINWNTNEEANLNNFGSKVFLYYVGER